MSAETVAETKASQLATMPKAAMNFMPTNIEGAIKLSELLAKTGLLPDSLKQKPNDVLYILMAGAEFGIPPTVAIREMYVVNGRPGFSSLLKVGLVKNSPLCAYFKLIKSTPEVAIFETKRTDEGVTRLEFTIEQARAAGYTSKKGGEWERNPALMLRRRCSGQLCDEVYPDVTRGAISTDVDDADDVTAPPTPWATRVSSTPAPRAAPVADDLGLGDPPASPPQNNAPAPSVESTAPAPSNGKPAATGRDAELDLQLEAAFAVAKTKADIKATAALAGEVEEPELKAYWRNRYTTTLKEMAS